MDTTQHKKMEDNKFAHARYLTTNEDLKRILQQCETCYKVTQKAELIILSHQLPQVRIGATKLTKLAFFIHEQTPNQNVGHWILLCIQLSRDRRCLVIDPLVNSNRNTMNHIKSFCSANNLAPIFFSVPFQRKNSQNCGYLCLYMLFKFAHAGIYAIYKMRGTITSNPLHHVEVTMIKKVTKHFRITI